MPVKKKQTLTDKSIKQNINIKIGTDKPKTKRVVRKRKPKTPIEVQPEVKTIYQTALTRDFNVYTDEINKRNEAKKEEFKLKEKADEAKKKAEEEAKKKAEEDTKKKLEEEAKKKAEEDAKKKLEEEAKKKAEEEKAIKKAEKEAKKKAKEDAKKKEIRDEEIKQEIMKNMEIKEEARKKKAEEDAKKSAIVYDYKKNSVFNPEGLEPKSTMMSKELVENKPLFTKETKPKEPIYDYKKYSTPAGAFIPQSTEISKEPIPKPENIIKERGRPKTEETTLFIRQTETKIRNKKQMFSEISKALDSGELKGKPEENARKKLDKLKKEIDELESLLNTVE